MWYEKKGMYVRIFNFKVKIFYVNWKLRENLKFFDKDVIRLKINLNLKDFINMGEDK